MTKRTPEERLYDIPEDERSRVLLERLNRAAEQLWAEPRDCRHGGSFAEKQELAATSREQMQREDDEDELTVPITRTIHSGDACRQDDPATVRIF